MKFGGFQEIQWISPEIQQISCEIHPKPYKIRCFNKNSSVWGGGVQGGGYDPGFHEILVHSPSPAFIKLNSFGWNICFYKVLGGFHMKSTGFHVKLKDHLQGIVTLCFYNVTSAAQFSPQQNYQVYPLLWGIHFLLGHTKWPPLADCIQYGSPLAESNLMKYANIIDVYIMILVGQSHFWSFLSTLKSIQLKCLKRTLHLSFFRNLPNFPAKSG